MKKTATTFALAISLVLSGCGDGNDTSSGSGSIDQSGTATVVNTETGQTINVSFSATQATVEDVISVMYTVKDANGNETSGTINWGDNSTDRIAGTASVRHIFRNPGSYRVTVQPDGGDKQLVGTVTISRPMPMAAGTFSSNISRGASPSRVCLVSDMGDFNVAAAGFSFSPDPGNGLPFEATLSINGNPVSMVSGVTDDESGTEETFVFARFKGNAPGATFGDTVSYSFAVDGYGTSSGSSKLNDCRNCTGTNPSVSCTPQAIFSQ